jgi:hypothetical protein
MRPSRRAGVIAAASLLGVLLATAAAPADAAPSGAGGSGAPAGYWTAERMAAATPRDLVVDQRGLGYLRRADGSLEPHGHDQGQLYPATAGAPARAIPAAKPGGGSSSNTSVTNRTPAEGATITTSTITFSATVTDPDGIRSVSFAIRPASGGTTQTFTASPNGSTYSASLEGFTSGSWTWYVVVRDRGPRGGSNYQSPTTDFTVSLPGDGGGGGGTGTVVADAEWTAGGQVQTAAGRLYFEMPSGPLGLTWAAYVCSGTVAEDAATGRSVIITAAHCAYDDEHKVFARNVLFIPNQDATTGSGTDTDCSNDPLGCWAPSFAVVDTNYTTRTFPDNDAWDYAYYVVHDTGAHRGTGADGALDAAAGDLPVQFTAPTAGAYTHALGYSYSQDPHFRYCAEGLGTTNGVVNWWLDQCDLSGGSSGGPWIQPLDTATGAGPIVSVNSWGYTTRAGMAGPRLHDNSAGCLFGRAQSQDFATVTDRGVATVC